jgi:hypothetical protein
LAAEVSAACRAVDGLASQEHTLKTYEKQLQDPENMDISFRTRLKDELAVAIYKGKVAQSLLARANKIFEESANTMVGRPEQWLPWPPYKPP